MLRFTGMLELSCVSCPFLRRLFVFHCPLLPFAFAFCCLHSLQLSPLCKSWAPASIVRVCVRCGSRLCRQSTLVVSMAWWYARQNSTLHPTSILTDSLMSQPPCTSCSPLRRTNQYLFFTFQPALVRQEDARMVLHQEQKKATRMAAVSTVPPLLASLCGYVLLGDRFVRD